MLFRSLSEAVRIDYVVQLEVDLPHFKGQIRLSAVEVDTLGNLSNFSNEIIVEIDSIAPGGVTDLQLVPTI